MLPLHDQFRLSSAIGKETTAAIRALQTLQDAVQGGWLVLDVVIQDEFTHDVVIRVDGDVYAVFDST